MFKKLLNLIGTHKYAFLILFLILLVIVLGFLNQIFKNSNKKDITKEKESITGEIKKYTYDSISKDTYLGTSVSEFNRFSKLIDINKKLTLSVAEASFLSRQSFIYSFTPISPPDLVKKLGLSNYSEPGEDMVRGNISLSKDAFLKKYLTIINNSSGDFTLIPAYTVYLASLQGSEFEITNQKNASAVKEFYFLYFKGYPLLTSKGGLVLISVLYNLSTPNKISVDIPLFLPKALATFGTTIVEPGIFPFVPTASLDFKFSTLQVNGQIDDVPQAFLVTKEPAFLAYALFPKKGLLVPFPAKYLEYKGKNNSLLDDNRVIFVLNE